MIKKLLESGRFDYILETFQLTVCDDKLYAFDKKLSRKVPVQLDACFYLPTIKVKELILKYPDMFCFGKNHGYTKTSKYVLDNIFSQYDNAYILQNYLSDSLLYIGVHGFLFEFDEYILNMIPLDDFSLIVELIEFSNNCLYLEFFHKDLV